jgi:DNA-directed RNA polymerase alpha subunit
MTHEEQDLPKLSAPARRALARAGYDRLDQLTDVREADLAKLHGMGPGAIKTISDALKQNGLSLRE